jgi:hypothetical protein
MSNFGKLQHLASYVSHHNAMAYHNKWYEKYALVAIGESFIIVTHPHDACNMPVLTRMLMWRQ